METEEVYGKKYETKANFPKTKSAQSYHTITIMVGEVGKVAHGINDNRKTEVVSDEHTSEE